MKFIDTQYTGWCHTDTHVPKKMLCGLPYLCPFLKSLACISALILGSFKSFSGVSTVTPAEPSELQARISPHVYPLGTRNPIHFFKSSSSLPILSIYSTIFPVAQDRKREIICDSYSFLIPHVQNINPFLSIYLLAQTSSSPSVHWPRVIFQPTNLT